MQLHIKSKEIAWSGIMMAIGIILIILASVIESSSLFLLAASSFICGLVQRKFSVKISILFTIGTFILGMILAPNKLYCFTFLGFSVYIVAAEIFRERLEKLYREGNEKEAEKLKKISFAVKLVLYHFLLAIAVVSIKLFFGLKFSDILSVSLFDNKVNFVKSPTIIIILCIIAAEILWILFDKAYIFFQNRYGGLIIRND